MSAPDHHSRTLLVWDERCMWHDTGNVLLPPLPGGWAQPHPVWEGPEGKRRVKNLLDATGMTERLTLMRPEPATEEQLLRVHTPGHIARIRAASELGGDGGDGATPVGRGSYEIACISAGGVIAALTAVADGTHRTSYALVRPPGHHALPDSGMGFCLFNNIGVAIQEVRSRGLATRIAIVDWDVHHGNGTQAVFYDDPDVLTISVHQDGKFPITGGALDERGEGPGLGANLNIPLPAGSGNGAYAAAMDDVILPALRAFAPDLIVVASGYDANLFDPLGRQMVTAGQYGRMAAQLVEAAAELCDGRLAVVHEGGYSPEYVPFCALRVIEAISGQDSGVMPEQHGEDWMVLHPGQALQPHQAEVIAKAAALVNPAVL